MADGAGLRGAFFDFDGEAYLPREGSRSPWNRGHQNGVAVAGLLAHLVEQVPTPVPMVTAHIAIDILRGVPFAPNLGRAEVVREGRKLQMVESCILADGAPVARARVMRVREAETPVVAATAAYPQVEDLAEQRFVNAQGVFGELVDTRVVHGMTGAPGPGAVWVRFSGEVVAGFGHNPVICAAMLGDFPNGVSNVLPRGRWSFANVDISVHMARRPVGEWLLVDAHTLSQGQGLGLATGVLADREGPFGYAHQTLFVAPLG